MDSGVGAGGKAELVVGVTTSLLVGAGLEVSVTDVLVLASGVLAGCAVHPAMANAASTAAAIAVMRVIFMLALVQSRYAACNVLKQRIHQFECAIPILGLAADFGCTLYSN